MDSVIGTRLCPPNIFSRILALSILLTSLACSGCGKDSQYETIHGLQEENKVLKQQIADLESKIKLGGQDAESQNQALRKQLEDEFAAKVQIQKNEVALIQKELSDVRLELGATRRENLTLKEVLAQPPRVEEAKKVRAGFITMVMWVLMGSLLLLLGYVLFRYRAAQDRLNFLTMQQVGELRHLRSGS